MSDDVSNVVKTIPKEVLEVFRDNVKQLLESRNFEYIFEGKKNMQ
ncbi:MAG: hypothetical protein ABIF85_03130 [Nanoarchaeota archaeon]